MKKSLVVFFLSLLLILPSFAAINGPKNKLEKRAYDATFALYGQRGSEIHFLCTAVAYEKINGGYHLLSAGHCVKDAPEGVEFGVAEKIGSPIVSIKVLKAEFNADFDFSVFELKTSKIYPTVSLGTEQGVRIGDKVFSPNFTSGSVEHLSPGIVSSQDMSVSPVCDSCKDHFMVQLFEGGGASGAVVISRKTGRVIGIVVGGFSANIGADVEPISKFQTFLNNK